MELNTLTLSKNLPDEIREPTTVADPVDQLLRRAAQYRLLRPAEELELASASSAATCARRSC